MSVSVLVPMDDSEPSWAALEYVLSSYPSAAITVLYVVDTTNPMGYGDLFAPAVWHENAGDPGAELLAEAERLAEGHGVELEATTERGSPIRTIGDFTEEHGFDHVVMGSHRRTGLNRLFMGSVAERVVRRVSVPVTIVP